MRPDFSQVSRQCLLLLRCHPFSSCSRFCNDVRWQCIYKLIIKHHTPITLWCQSFKASCVLLLLHKWKYKTDTAIKDLAALYSRKSDKYWMIFWWLEYYAVKAQNNCVWVCGIITWWYFGCQKITCTLHMRKNTKFVCRFAKKFARWRF